MNRVPGNLELYHNDTTKLYGKSCCHIGTLFILSNCPLFAIQIGWVLCVQYLYTHEWSNAQTSLLPTWSPTWTQPMCLSIIRAYQANRTQCKIYDVKYKLVSNNNNVDLYSARIHQLLVFIRRIKSFLKPSQLLGSIQHKLVECYVYNIYTHMSGQMHKTRLSPTWSPT